MARLLAPIFAVLCFACAEQPSAPPPVEHGPSSVPSSVAEAPVDAGKERGAAPPAPAPLATGLAAAAAAVAPGDPRGPGLELLRVERDAAKGSERALFDRMVRLGERMTAAGTDDAALSANGAAWLREYVAICRDVAKTAPDDVALQAEMARLLLAVPDLATRMGIDPKPFEGTRGEATAMVAASMKRQGGEAR